MWNVDIPSRDELVSLAQLRAPGVVSIYLPTTPVTADAQADRIVLKNLSSDARSRLEQIDDLTVDDVAAIVDDVDELIDDDTFWEHQGRGLAVIATVEHLWIFRLAEEVSSQVHVSDRAFLTPLLSAVSNPRTCYVLALAEGGVRLVEVPADLPPSTVRINDLPSSAADAAGKASIGDRSHSGRLVGSEGKRVHIRRYARYVDAALRPVLSGSDTPMILAAVEPVRSIFRSVNSYPHLPAEGIETNPDRSTDQELAVAARDVLQAVFTRSVQERLETFETRNSQGRAATDVAQVARAATAGAVDTLIIDRDHVLTGSVEDDGAVSFDETGPTAIVDEIARRVVLAGGRVVSIGADDVPGDQPLAAILRYAF